MSDERTSSSLECTFPFFCCYKITVVLHSSDNTAIMSASSNSDEDAQEIRQRAFDLLNRMGGPSEKDDVNEWPQSPEAARQSYSSYQQQASGEPSRSSSSIPASIRVQSDSSSRSSASSASSFTEVFVSCVSDACRMASSEILSQQGSVLRTGYDSLKSVVIPEAEDRWFASRSKTYAPVSGTYQTVDIPQGYRGRYSDNPAEQKH